MNRQERAKIFASFSPLKGFGEALLSKERVIVPKAELSDDRIEEIELEMQKLCLGDMVKIIFYNNGEYEKVVGCVGAFCPEEKYLTVAKRRINFDDIYDFSIED